MSLKFYPFAIMSLLVFLISCQNNDNDTLIEEEMLSVETANVYLRIENQTNVQLESIISNDQDFGNLNASTTTDYIGFSQIYIWPKVSFQLDGDLYNWTSPIDNVGFWSSIYESGNYTLFITEYDVDSHTLQAYIEED